MAQRPLMFSTQTSATSNASPEAFYDVITDLRAHLEWSGERASDDKFKLLSLEAPEGQATVGNLFVIETDSRLDRKSAEPWEAHFSHRYDVEPEGKGSRIVYTDTVERVNYLPYWLKPWTRPIFRILVNRADVEQLRNLARLAEERSAG